MWNPGWGSGVTFLVEKGVSRRKDFSGHRQGCEGVESQRLTSFGGRFEQSRVMTPIPGKTLEFAFPDAAQDSHAFARESKREEPMPFGAKLGPLDLARQIELANDDRLFAGRRRWGEGPREPLGVSSISQMTIGIASEESIFGREANEPLHQPIGLAIGKVGALELVGNQNAREI